MTWNAQKWLALFFVAGVLSGQTVLAQTNVFIGGYGNSRTNANLTETVLTPSTVKPGEFGKRFSLTVDGQIYAQPLYVRGGAIPHQGSHNVVFVATMHNTVYAFDADVAGMPLWSVNLGPAVPSTTYGLQLGGPIRTYFPKTAFSRRQ